MDDDGLEVLHVHVCCSKAHTLARSGDEVGSAAATAANARMAVFMVFVSRAAGQQLCSIEYVLVRKSLLIARLPNSSQSRAISWLHGIVVPSAGYASLLLRLNVF